MQPLTADDPHTVDVFRLRARLGTSNTGTVYLGYSPAGRAVAIKVVRPELARSDEFMARFRNEVAAAHAVNGMYAAIVVASGLDADLPWLATAFVPGPTLDAVVADHGPLPELALWRLADGLVEALQAIHAQGLVHRNLNPSNVLLAADGPHVIGFGIPRGFDAAGGTPGYFSPEQARGGEVGPWSDVFSLASVLAYAATGAPPFGTGNTAFTVYRVVFSEPDLTRVSPHLHPVLQECLRKNPAERPSLSQLAIAFSEGASHTASLTNPSLTEYWPASVATVIGDATASRPPAARDVFEQTTSALGYPGSGQGSPEPFGREVIRLRAVRTRTRRPDIRLNYFFALAANMLRFVGSSLQGMFSLFLKSLLLLFRILAEFVVPSGDLAVIRADPATLRADAERFIWDQIDRAYLALGPPPETSSPPSGGRSHDE